MENCSIARKGVETLKNTRAPIDPWSLLVALLTIGAVAIVAIWYFANRKSKEGKLRITLSGGFVLVPFLMAAMSVPVFAYVLQDDCSSPAAYASTISKISASIIPEGYVYMLVALSLFALVISSKIDRMQKERVEHVYGDDVLETPLTREYLRAAYWCEAMINFGIATTTVAAVLPDRAHDCGEVHLSCPEELMGNFHKIGIGGGVLLSMLGANLRMHFNLSPSKSSCERRLRPISHIVTLLSVLLFALGVMMFTSGGFDHEADASHICTHYETPRTCRGTDLPASRLHLDVGEAWPCVWNPAARGDQKPCVNPCCKVNGELYVMQYAIVCEYGLLVLWTVLIMGALIHMEKSHDELVAELIVQSIETISFNHSFKATGGSTPADRPADDTEIEKGGGGGGKGGDYSPTREALKRRQSKALGHINDRAAKSKTASRLLLLRRQWTSWWGGLRGAVGATKAFKAAGNSRARKRSAGETLAVKLHPKAVEKGGSAQDLSA